MKTCEEYEALISDFLDGELSAEDRAEVAEHLASCPACQRYFDDLAAIHAAFRQIEEAPVPDGFGPQIMDRVRETPQAETKKIIFFPHWKRWAALAACCAIAALGLWNAQQWAAFHKTVSQTAMAESAPFTARDASEEIATIDDAPRALMMDEDNAVFPEDAPEPHPEEAFSEAQKQCRDTYAGASGSLPETKEDALEAELDDGYSRDGADMPELAMALPAPAEGDRGEPLSGIITASGEAARTWVESELGLAWEPGRTYLLTEEEYAGLLETLELAGEAYSLEPGEDWWLLAG